jgi:ABC-type multidrug transport system ATPase subunit
VRPPDYVGWFRQHILRKPRPIIQDVTAGAAVEIDHIRKEYSTKTLGVFGRGKPVVAIEDLSFSIPKGEIFCLLGRNGAAKSTTLSAIARLLSITSGRIRYGEDLHIGIASQKDVLWDELTCLQVSILAGCFMRPR